MKQKAAKVAIEAIASDEVIDRAYGWLCSRREHYSSNHDVWNVRWRWKSIKPLLQAELRAGRYRFGAVQRVRRNHDAIELWSALDALVLKAMAIVLSRSLKLPRSCYHLRGHGGPKAAVRDVVAHLPGNAFVFRTDVKSYYAGIDHDVLMSQLMSRITDARVLNLVEQYIRRTIYWEGYYQEVKCGISLGCPLSPIMGALYLEVLDRRMEETALFYARFMDDWVILAHTRWQLRRAVKLVMQTLTELKLVPHPDKTYIGRASRGFSFLGYTIASAGIVGIAPQTRERFVERLTRLYEQGAPVERIGDYVRRWHRWAVSGLGACGNSISCLLLIPAAQSPETQKGQQARRRQHESPGSGDYRDRR
jgi:RNA-directed DNA polymerase